MSIFMCHTGLSFNSLKWVMRILVWYLEFIKQNCIIFGTEDNAQCCPKSKIVIQIHFKDRLDAGSILV